MIRWLIFLFSLTGAASAETARVMSGEHADFTRLVVELPQMSDWTVGRTPMGYGFAAPGAEVTGYDLARVWDRIPRTRLQALRPGAENGALFLTLACNCHVIPFEFRPGMVVLDIRDGPAPEGSAFEAAFTIDDTHRAQLDAPIPRLADDTRNYSWIDGPRSNGASPGPDSLLPLPAEMVSLDLLREALLMQISRGAAHGIVDMQLPSDGLAVGSGRDDAFPWSRIRIGDMPGIATGSPVSEDRGLAPDNDCMPDERLDLAAWAGLAPVGQELAAARSGLVGEFDKIDSAAVQRAVQAHLHLGFGAEAAQYARLLDGDDIGQEVAVYASMARLVDGLTDPASPFATMLGCSGRAALWAALAVETLPEGRLVDSDAIVRSFQELPIHLRRSLGPALAQKFLDRNDPEPARVIRDTLARLPGSDVASLALLDAKAALQADQPTEARSEASRALIEGTWEPEALSALVAAHAFDRQPLRPEIAESLLAFVRDASPDQASEILPGAVVALALSGQSGRALALAAEHSLPTADVWAVMVDLSPDDEFLRHAVFSVGTPLPVIAEDTALAIADRLMGLGLAAPALAWLGPIAVDDPVERRRLAAEAHLSLGAASMALEHLSGLVEPEDELLRAQALVQLGQLEDARRSYLSAGMEEDAERVQRWGLDWTSPVASKDSAWQKALADLSPTAPTAEEGALARGRALIDDSADTRAAIQALLDRVPGP